MPQPEAKEPQPEAKEEADQQKSPLESAEPAGELPQLCTLYSTNLHYPILRSLVV